MQQLKFEKFENKTDSIIGTIRTTPENYYVASVHDSGIIIFEGIEVNTRNINKDAVFHWANMNNIFGDGIWR